MHTRHSDGHNSYRYDTKKRDMRRDMCVYTYTAATSTHPAFTPAFVDRIRNERLKSRLRYTHGTFIYFSLSSILSSAFSLHVSAPYIPLCCLSYFGYGQKSFMSLVHRLSPIHLLLAENECVSLLADCVVAF